ncbi:MAG: hypothetical protein HYZ13_02145 [Acidobacteria bacterium]|nr:hypothetical protein [Acidobacteriota bacterium]
MAALEGSHPPRRRRAARLVAATIRTLLLLGGLALIAAPPGQAPAPLAVWAWEGAGCRLFNDPAQTTRAGAKLRRRGVRTLYLHPGDCGGADLLTEDPGKVQAVLTRLHARGLRVEALLGSGSWHPKQYLLPEHRGRMQSQIQRILDYNRNAAPDARFDGLHLDMEPYAHADWTEGSQEDLARLYLERASEWVAQVHDADSNLQVGAAIPFWYDGLEVMWRERRRPLNQWVQDLFGYVVVMDYRHRAQGQDGIIALAQEELNYGDLIGRPVIIGLETAPAVPAKVTFHGRGPGALAREMAVARRAFARHSSFGGFALHHLGSWMPLY